MKTTTFLILLVTTLIVRAESAPEGGATENALSARLSLGEVTRNVLENNPAIQQALSKWNAARARITQEAAWDDLRVSGGLGAARVVGVAPHAFTAHGGSGEAAKPLTREKRL